MLALNFQSEYNKINEKIEQMTQLAYLTTIKITVPGTMLPMVVASVLNYLYYGMGEDSFLLPYFVLYVSFSFGRVGCHYSFFLLFYLFRIRRLPFNWRTPFGYFVAMFLECIGSYSNLLITFVMICFYFGSCWLISLFVK